jgi:hypothetical protein
MAIDVANFFARTSPRFNPTAMENDQYNNALLRGQVEAIPQQQRMNDQLYQMHAQDMENQREEMTQRQRANATGLLANRFAAVANSPSPRLAAQQFLSDPNFQAAGKVLGLPVERFSVTDQDTDEGLRTSAADWARALGAQLGRDGGSKIGLQPQYGVDEQGNPVLFQLSDDGQAVLTQMPAGVNLSRDPMRIDAGTDTILLDPVTRLPVGRIPNNIEGANAAKQIGDATGKAYGEIQADARNAQQTLARLDTLDDLLARIETGKLAGVKKTISEVGQALGIDVEGLNETQAFQALTNQLALQMRNPSTGAGMPGAMSDRDREFLLQTVPNLLNTPGGNKQIIAFARVLAKRSQQIAALARDYRRRNGGKMDDNFIDELEQWSASNPLFNQGESGQGGGDINLLLEKYAPR